MAALLGAVVSAFVFLIVWLIQVPLPGPNDLANCDNPWVTGLAALALLGVAPIGAVAGRLLAKSATIRAPVVLVSALLLLLPVAMIVRSARAVSESTTCEKKRQEVVVDAGSGKKTPETPAAPQPILSTVQPPTGPAATAAKAAAVETAKKKIEEGRTIFNKVANGTVVTPAADGDAVQVSDGGAKQSAVDGGHRAPPGVGNGNPGTEDRRPDDDKKKNKELLKALAMLALIGCSIATEDPILCSMIPLGAGLGLGGGGGSSDDTQWSTTFGGGNPLGAFAGMTPERALAEAERQVRAQCQNASPELQAACLQALGLVKDGLENKDFLKAFKQRAAQWWNDEGSKRVDQACSSGGVLASLSGDQTAAICCVRKLTSDGGALSGMSRFCGDLRPGRSEVVEAKIRQAISDCQEKKIRIGDGVNTVAVLKQLATATCLGIP